MTNPNTNRTGVLARLLATENIRVVHDASVPSAAFELKTRTLVLPMWKCEKVVYDFLVGHEVAHAKYTPADRWRGEAERIGKKNARIAQDYINVIEDARIERLIKREFPGLRSDFMQGYKVLHEMDIFQINGKDLSTLSLIDRINLHYKIGIHCGVQIPFTDEERKILDRISNTRSGDIGFTDVVQIAEELFNAAKQQGDMENPKQKGQKQKGQQQDENGSEGEDGSDGEEQDENGSDGANGSGGPESDEEDNKQGGKGDEKKDGEDSGMSSEDDTDDGSAAESRMIASENEEQDENDLTEMDGKSATVADVSTNKAMSNAMQGMVDVSHVEHQIVVHEVDHSKIVVGVDDFIGLVDKSLTWNPWYKIVPGTPGNTIEDRAASIFKRVCDENKRNVDLMCKRFEVKRSARNFAKQSSAKTGRISTRLLSKYKFSEDIFDRITIRNDEKNHGIVILIDWSGSIGSMIAETCSQVCALLMFCRRAGIAAEVYYFTDAYVPCMKEWDIAAEADAAVAVNRYSRSLTRENKFTDLICNLPDGTAAQGNTATFTPFSLVKVYEQGMDNKKFCRAIGRLLLVAHAMSNNGSEAAGLTVNEDLGLGGTPLDESIIALRGIVREFRKSSNTKVTLINLTDGEGTSLVARVQLMKKQPGVRTISRVTVDASTGRRFDSTNRYDHHGDFVEMFRDGTGANIVGIYLTRNTRGAEYISAFQKSLHSTKKTNHHSYIDACNKSYKDDMYIAFEYKPYDMYFAVNVPDRDTVRRGVEALERKAANLKNRNNAATRTFIAKMKAEEVNRMFINRLMDVIA